MEKAIFTAPVTLAEYKAQLQAIPGGSFEQKGFTVTLSPFQMGRTPVTVGMWQEYAKAKLKRKMPERPDFPVWKDGWDAVRDHPIVSVSWDECRAYADWAELLLPTEAQWEYAARGGLKDKKYPWGDEEPKEQLWWTPTSGDEGTAPVERTNDVFVNGYGLVDMAGNVWQWCTDWFGEYAKHATTNPIGATQGDYMALRGGSWQYDYTSIFRCADRNFDEPFRGHFLWGFRLSSP
ncbi:formylglycine-generating enzyme family protein [Armatimonas sp.]|uniref:formylglycine-generating enzyme family protein n=1 Tax=Armatimonas sp. TaxID=1872638 RepID=UPI003752C140